ncbi:hypothetical protein J4731_19935 [Providencia rettgeri]|nr:hypothetical protein [Providencia rettgeri]
MTKTIQLLAEIKNNKIMSELCIGRSFTVSVEVSLSNRTIISSDDLKFMNALAPLLSSVNGQMV